MKWISMDDLLERLIKQNLRLVTDNDWDAIASAQIKVSSGSHLPVRAACIAGHPEMLHALTEQKPDLKKAFHLVSSDRHSGQDYKIGLFEDTLYAFISRKDIDRSDTGKKAYLDVMKHLTRSSFKENDETILLNEDPLESAFLVAHFLAHPELSRDPRYPHHDMCTDTYNQEPPEKWEAPYALLKERCPNAAKKFEAALENEIKSPSAQLRIAGSDGQDEDAGFKRAGDVIPPAKPNPEP